ncbi:MAG: TonB-dependent receptor plug domain-containing protein [Verrucomicrobia bacterium]|nr:TonB-dependent receptor plug domain-containing protein [Verrucomicrobiota bacterium]
MRKHSQKKLASAVCGTLTAGVAGQLMTAPNVIAQADTNATTTLKPVVITGSSIPQTEGTTVSPVQTITAEDIHQAGSGDVLQVLAKISPQFYGSGNIGQVANNFSIAGASPAGEANVAIRNLPTLVLLNGRRLGNSALSAGQLVDVNTIPLAMIEKIEVLKDGASSIYGSDAIGGVINVITKKNWNGVEISGRVGFPTRPDSNGILERRASIVAGASTERTSFTAGGSYYYMDPLLSKDRAFASASTLELANHDIAPPTYFSPSYPAKVQAGGVSYILAGSPFAIGAPGYNAAVTSPPIVTGGPFAGASSVVNYNAAAKAQLGYTPYLTLGSTPFGQALDAIGQGEPLFPGLNTTSFGTHTIQTQDRRNAFANFEHDLFGKNLQVYGEFLFANNMSRGELAPSPVPSLAVSSIFVPANNVYNPFGTDLGVPGGSGTPRVRSRFVDSGNRIFDAQSDTYHLVGGFKGEISPKYDYDAAYTYNRADQTYFTRNAINGAALGLALQPNDDPALAAQGLSRLNGGDGNPVPQYNIFSVGGQNNPATVNALKTTLFRSGVSEMWSFDGVVRGRPFELPAGDFQFAVGGSYVSESIALATDGLTQQGLVPGLSQESPFPGGKRDRGAGFVEVVAPIFSEQYNIPAFHALTLDASGRYEMINPGGDSGVPKIGITWKPVDDQWTIRANYTEAFLAPSVYNLFGPNFVNNPNVPLPNGAGGTQPGQIETHTSSNPNLPSSDSTQWTIGTSYSPKQIPGLTLTLDYYNIKQDKIVVSDPYAAVNSLNALGSASPWAAGFVFADQTRLASTAQNQVTVDNFGTLNLTNTAAASLKTHGLDLGVTYAIPTETCGKFTVFGNANWILDYKISASLGAPFYSYEGTYTSGFGTSQGYVPEYRIVTGLNWDYRDFSYSIIGNYLPAVTDFGSLHPQAGLTEHGNTVSGNAFPVSDYFTISMQVGYEFGKSSPSNKWLKGLRLAFGVNNITDETPPFVASGIEDNTAKEAYDILGRFVYFEVSKKF